MASYDEARELQLVDSAVYLGVVVGPGSSERQRQGVIAKAIARTAVVAPAAPSLGSRVLAFSMHFASLFAFKVQFVRASAQARKIY